MKILMLADFYYSGEGGLQTHVQSLVKALSSRGHDVFVCTIGQKDIPREKNFALYALWGIFQRIPLLFRNKDMRYAPPIRDWLIARRLAELIRILDPDVIHVHGWLLYSVISLAERFQIPLVATLHDYGFICPRRGSVMYCSNPLTFSCILCGREVFGILKSLFVFFALKVNKPNLRKVDRYIAISPYQMDVFRRSLGFDEDKVVLIPNGIDLSRFYPGVSESFVPIECAALMKGHHERRVVHVGRMSVEKMDAPLAILEAARTIVSKFPDTVIWIVGSGEYYHRLSSLGTKVNEDLKKDVVVFTGPVAVACMPAVLDRATVIIGVGRVAYEAMACGKAVIVAGSARGPLGGNYGGVVSPSNVADLEVHNFSGRNARNVTNGQRIADDCIRLLGDDEYRLKIGGFGRSYIETEHSLEAVAARVEDLYLDLLAKKGRTAK